MQGTVRQRTPTVLYVDTSIGFGGASKSLALLLRGLTGVRPLLLSAQDSEELNRLFGSVKSWRFRTHVNYRARFRLRDRLRARGRLIRWAGMKGFAALDLAVSPMVVIKILRIIKRYDVDLVHLNNRYIPGEAILAARLSGVPVVAHLREYLDSPIPGEVLRAARKVDRTIAVSDAAVENLVAVFPELRVTKIQNPVDVEAMESASGARLAVRESLGATEADILVGIVGRVVPWKGQLEFVRACLGAMREEARIMAVVVGDVSDGLESYLDDVRREIDQSGFQDRFVLTGFRKDVEAIYHAIDIAVHASTSPEPFGRVIPEAMAAGCPVIASDAGGPREIIAPGVDGLLVPPGEVAALRDAILRLARDPEERRAMGERGARKVARHFTIEQAADQVLEVYRQLLARSGRS